MKPTTQHPRQRLATAPEPDSPLLRRFLRYVTFDTQSSPTSGTHPSTPGQLVFGHAIADELRALGAQDVRQTEDGYVYAAIPASPGRAGEAAIGFLAHLDTAAEASGADVRPQVVRYGGGILPLGNSGKVLDPAEMPWLGDRAGRTLVVTDGTTLLGADDKAGVAILVTLAGELLAPDAPPHGPVRLAFTPDEEIGEGPRGFDIAGFGAAAAFTVDGGNPDALQCSNFNAAYATFDVRGAAVHPGGAKGTMVNAIKVAAEILAALPPEESPERTEGLEGFFHPDTFEGSVGAARLGMLVRDFDAAGFNRRKDRLLAIAGDLRARYGEGAVSLTIRDQYRNMDEVMRDHQDLVKTALAAIAAEGLKPRLAPVRGGTDGATLSWRGLPCPNLGTGGYAAHGEREFLVVEEFETAYRIVRRLACRI